MPKIAVVDQVDHSLSIQSLLVNLRFATIIAELENLCTKIYIWVATRAAEPFSIILRILENKEIFQKSQI